MAISNQMAQTRGINLRRGISPYGNPIPTRHNKPGPSPQRARSGERARSPGPRWTRAASEVLGSAIDVQA